MEGIVNIEKIYLKNNFICTFHKNLKKKKTSLVFDHLVLFASKLSIYRVHVKLSSGEQSNAKSLCVYDVLKVKIASSLFSSIPKIS